MKAEPGTALAVKSVLAKPFALVEFSEFERLPNLTVQFTLAPLTGLPLDETTIVTLVLPPGFNTDVTADASIVRGNKVLVNIVWPEVKPVAKAVTLVLPAASVELIET